MKTSKTINKVQFLYLFVKFLPLFIPWDAFSQVVLEDTNLFDVPSHLMVNGLSQFEENYGEESRTLALMVQEWSPLLPQRSYFYKPKKKVGLEFQFFLGGDVPDKAMGIDSESQRSAVISSFHVIYNDYGIGSTPVYHRHEEGKNTIYEFTNESADISNVNSFKYSTIKFFPYNNFLGIP